MALSTGTPLGLGLLVAGGWWLLVVVARWPSLVVVYGSHSYMHWR
jgi:hypothetical protein